jgi:nitrogen-specific signal transduction histidine kinase
MPLFHIIVTGVNLIACSLLATTIYIKRPQSRQFLFLHVSVVFWSFFAFVSCFISSKKIFFHSYQLIAAIVVLIPFFFLNFCYEISDKKQGKGMYLYNITAAILFVGLAFTNLLVVDVRPILTFQFWPRAGLLYPLFLGYFYINFVMGLTMLFKLWRVDIIARYLFVGVVIALIGGSTNFLLWFGVPVSPFWNILITFALGLFTYAFVRYKAFDLKLVVSKTAAHIITIILFLLVYLGLNLVIHNYYMDENGFFAVAINVCFFVLACELFTKVRLGLQSVPEQVFFHSRYNYQEAAKNISKKLEKCVSLNELFSILDAFYKDVLKIYPVHFFVNASFFREERGANALELWNVDLGCPEPGAGIEEIEKLLGCLDNNAIFYFQDFPEDIKKVLREYQAYTVLPILGGDGPLCLTILGKTTTGERYNVYDLDILETINSQVVIVLDRIRPYERIKADFQKSLEAAHKISENVSYATLVTGIAHEIRNPLASIRLGLDLICEEKLGIDSIDEYASMAEKNIIRIVNITDVMLKYGKPREKVKRDLDLNKTIEDVITLTEGEIKKRRIVIEKKVIPNAKIFGHSRQIYSLFSIIFINAYQSMENGGVLKIIQEKASFINVNGEMVTGIKVEIIDTGNGMNINNQKDVFTPFYTTKYGHVGLGLSNALQIINDHNGMIDIESEPGKGTKITIFF